MSHTPEPWETNVSDQAKNDEWEIFHTGADGETHWIAEFVNKDDAHRIVACLNGCAGLNPAAYREVVEALREFSTLFEQGYFENALTMPSGKRIVLGVKDKVKQALAHAEASHA